MQQNCLAIEKSIFERFSVSQLFDARSWDKALILFAAVIALICYGYDIFNFSLRIDAEMQAEAYGANMGWISQGRWTMYYLNLWLLPDPVMPVIPPLISIIGLVIGSLLFIASLSSGRGLPAYLAVALFISCPLYYYAHYFTTLGYGIGVGYALAGLGTYLLMKCSWPWLLLVIVCYTLAIGVYQAFLPVLAAMFGISMIDAYIKSTSNFKLLLTKSISFAAVLLLSYTCYELIKTWMISYWETTFAEAYLSGFNKFELSKAYFDSAVVTSYENLMKYYLGDKSIYLYELATLKTLMVAAMSIAIVRIIFFQKKIVAKLLSLLIGALVVFTPMAILMMNDGFMPQRTQLAVPVIIAGLCYLAASIPVATLRGLMLCLATAAIYKFCVVDNRFAFANDMQWQADKVITQQIINGLVGVTDQLPEKGYHDAYPLELVGVRYQTETAVLVNRDAIGASFYQWGAGDIFRMLGLMRSMGIREFKAAQVDQRLSVIEEAKKMPSWPMPGFVKVINGIAVVKISDYNANQLYRLCAGRKELPQCEGYN